MKSYDWIKSRAANWYSQFGEDGVLEAIFSVIGADNKWCFECGAADGLFFSNTRRLIEQGWTGILVEANAEVYQHLKANNTQFGQRVHCIQAEVGFEQRLEVIMAYCGAPLDIDLVVIDIDGQDYHIFNSILNYHPRVVLLEFDPTVDPSFVPAIGAKGQAGLVAIQRLAKGRFYEEVYRSYCNVVLVRQPLCRLIEDKGL